mgnify:CR=1 FL=1
MAFTKQTQNGVVFHTADSFTAAGGVAHGFATRLGGVSKGPYAELNLGITRPDEREAVRENYRRFCAAIGADADSLVMTHQVHEDGWPAGPTCCPTCWTPSTTGWMVSSPTNPACA